MKVNKTVVGVFTYVDDALQAIAAVKGGDHPLKVYAPTYVPEIDAATSDCRSPAGTWTLIGGAIGCVFGFALAILCALDWPLRVSAKEIVSVPGYVVIGYECTILFGALASLAGVFCLCRLPSLFKDTGYDARFSDDKFGVVVGCSTKDVEGVKAKLIDAGADEVDVRGAL